MQQGIIFKREYKKEWNDIPFDGNVGFIYCDPNYGRKEGADTTAIVKLYANTKTQKYYVMNVRCKQYTDPDKIMSDMLMMMDNRTVLLATANNKDHLHS
ncbi:MAG: hypothetical protein LBO69_04005 [Ignavibacteria bacterium]|nr:hypothetical protein [Ignavibacteria bacterium]